MIASFWRIIKYDDDYQLKVVYKSSFNFINSPLSRANRANIGSAIDIILLLNFIYIIAGSMRWITLQSKVRHTIGLQNNKSNTFLFNKIKKKSSSVMAHTNSQEGEKNNRRTFLFAWTILIEEANKL